MVGAALAAALTGCSGGEDLTESVEHTLTTPPAAVDGAAGPTTTTVPRLRDGDDLDLDHLVAEMTEGTTGDQEWIEIFATLRARSWIASRYPGEHDLSEIYDDYIAAEVVIPNQDDLMAHRLYLDQPIPRLISVEQTEEIGELVSLEVVLESDDMAFRSTDDDSIQQTVEGGRSRGRFTIGQDSTGQWRIHSQVELQVVDQPGTEEPTS
jgi:hypothetical protein